MTFSTTTMISISPKPVWQEQISATNQRCYTQAVQPTFPSTWTTGDQDVNTGISFMNFSSDGCMIACRDDTMPTAVWIWSVRLLELVAVFIQQSPVKQILWHPTIGTLLMIVTTTSEEPVVYQWDPEEFPRITPVPLESSEDAKVASAIRKYAAKWLPHSHHGHFLLTNALGDFVLGRVSSENKFKPLDEPKPAMTTNLPEILIQVADVASSFDDEEDGGLKLPPAEEDGFLDIDGSMMGPSAEWEVDDTFQYLKELDK